MTEEKTTLVEITPFSSSHLVSEDEIQSIVVELRKDKSNKLESDETLRSYAIRDILKPIVEYNIEFDFEEAKNND